MICTSTIQKTVGALKAGLLVFVGALNASAACPAGDPYVLYCEEFSGANPLGAYTVLNPLSGGSGPHFTISAANQALVYTNNFNGLAFAASVYGNPLPYRNTMFEADIRFDTANPNLRSAMAIAWTIPNPVWSEVILMSMQLDERAVVLGWGSAGNGGDRRYYFPIAPNTTYRLGFSVEEVAGINGPILAFKGYVDGSPIFAVTEESLGIDLSTLPELMHPTFEGGSYSYSAVNQVFDNGIVRQLVTLACSGFESPMDAGPVTVRKNRALPFKAVLIDDHHAPVTSLGSVPPVIQVTYAAAAGNPVDVTDLAVPAGMGTDGNQFVYSDGKWQFNLQTKGYSAAGTYTVTMTPGNGYTIEPSCSGSFVIK